MLIVLACARNKLKGIEKMSPIDIIFLVILLVSAAFIVVAVILQKSNEEGLSGTISGGSDTFYGKDKSADTDRVLYKWTLIASIIFGIAVLAVFVLQPDYDVTPSIDAYKKALTDLGITL
jgi:preprotein translocase subunit SecG